MARETLLVFEEDTLPFSAVGRHDPVPPCLDILAHVDLAAGTTAEDLACALDTFAKGIEEASITVRMNNKDVHSVYLANVEI